MANPTPILNPLKFTNGYNTVNDLLAAADPAAPGGQISHLHFLGCIYETLLNDHGLTEAAVTQFFYEFIRAYMLHHIDVTKYNLATDKYNTKLYAPPATPSATELSYTEYPRRYFSDASAKATNNTKLAGTYHTELYDSLAKADGDYFSLKDILDGTFVFVKTLPDFRFPPDVRQTLLNALGGAATLKNINHLELFIKIDKEDVGGIKVNKRLLLCLCDRRINATVFQAKYSGIYPVSMTYAGIMNVLVNNADYKNIDTIARKNLIVTYAGGAPIKLADRKRAEFISGRIISGVYSVYSDPPGEIAHLDIMRFFGQQFSFDEKIEKQKDPAYLKPIADGNVPYWKNLHLSTKSGAKAKFTQAGVTDTYGSSTNIDYYTDPNKYGTVYPLNHKQVRKNYLANTLASKQSSFNANITRKLAQIKASELVERKKMFEFRTAYFEIPLEYVKDTEYSRYYEPYKKLSSILLEKEDDYAKIIRKDQQPMLDNLQLLKDKLNDPKKGGPTRPEFQIDDILYFRNFKKKLNSAVGAFDAVPPIMLQGKDITHRSCGALGGEINISKEDVVKRLDTCEMDLRTQMVFQLNGSFRSHLLDEIVALLEKGEGKIIHYIENPKFSTLASYASVQSLSQALFRFIERDATKVEMFKDLFLGILKNIDLENYSIANPGEAYRTETEVKWVPPKQRRICFLLDFLYVMGLKISDISSKFDIQKRPLLNNEEEAFQEIMIENFKSKQVVNDIKQLYTNYLFVQNNLERLPSNSNFKKKPKKERDANLSGLEAQKLGYLNKSVTTNEGTVKFSVLLPIVQGFVASAPTYMIEKNNKINEHNEAIESEKRKETGIYKSIVKAMLGNNNLVFSLLYPINRIEYSTAQFETMEKMLKVLFHKTFPILPASLIQSLKGSFNKWLANHDASIEPGKSVKPILVSIIEDINSRLILIGKPTISIPIKEGEKFGLEKNQGSYEGNTNTRGTRRRTRRLSIASQSSNNNEFRKLQVRIPTPTSSLTNDPSPPSSGGRRANSRRFKRTRKNRKV